MLFTKPKITMAALMEYCTSKKIRLQEQLQYDLDYVSEKFSRRMEGNLQAEKAGKSYHEGQKLCQRLNEYRELAEQISIAYEAAGHATVLHIRLPENQEAAFKMWGEDRCKEAANQLATELRAAAEFNHIPGSKVLLVLPIGAEVEEDCIGCHYLYPWAGISLEDMLKTQEYKQLSPDQRVQIGTWLLVCIMKALDMLAKQGGIHRDIKPGNIIFNYRTGLFMLADFGIMVNASLEGYILAYDLRSLPPELCEHVKGTECTVLDSGRVLGSWDACKSATSYAMDSYQAFEAVFTFIFGGLPVPIDPSMLSKLAAKEAEEQGMSKQERSEHKKNLVCQRKRLFSFHDWQQDMPKQCLVARMIKKHIPSAMWKLLMCGLSHDPEKRISAATALQHPALATHAAILEAKTQQLEPAASEQLQQLQDLLWRQQQQPGQQNNSIRCSGENSSSSSTSLSTPPPAASTASTVNKSLSRSIAEAVHDADRRHSVSKLSVAGKLRSCSRRFKSLWRTSNDAGNSNSVDAPENSTAADSSVTANMVNSTGQHGSQYRPSLFGRFCGSSLESVDAYSSSSSNGSFTSTADCDVHVIIAADTCEHSKKSEKERHSGSNSYGAMAAGAAKFAQMRFTMQAKAAAFASKVLSAV